MAYKLLRWVLGITGLIVCLVAAIVIGSYYYIGANHNRLIQEAAHSAGMEVTYKEVDYRWWPILTKVTLVADSLTLRDTATHTEVPPLLSLDSFLVDISLNAVLQNTLRLQQINIFGGNVHLERDSSGRYNFGSLFEKKPQPRDTSGYAPAIDWTGLVLAVNDLGVFYKDPPKKKLVEFRLHELAVTGDKNDSGDLTLRSTIDAFVNGLALNSEKGTYLTETPLCGNVTTTINPDVIKILPTTLLIGAQEFEAAASVDRKGNESTIYINCDRVNYDLTRPILHDQLRNKLANIHVEGLFPVTTKITLLPEEPKNPKIEVDFELSGQKVRLQEYRFSEVHTRGAMINRLTIEEGGIPGSKKNLRILLDTTSGLLGNITMTTPHAMVGIIKGDTKLKAPLTISGPATSLGKQLKNRNFLFKRGHFSLHTAVDASLEDMDNLIGSSDGQLELTNASVLYKPAGVVLPFSRIKLQKKGEDVQFKVKSEPLPTGFAFELAGDIDNLTPLLLDRPGEALSSDVKLMSSRIDWTDFLAFFGDEGYFISPEDSLAVTVPQESMRKTLLGIKETFHPTIEAVFDTVAYYDVFLVTDFQTGLHFSADTLVLEKTKLNWADSQLRMGAKMDFSKQKTTQFNLNVLADHLNLNRLRPSLNYFGLKLPAELDSLPNDLSIQFEHQGMLDDTSGIVPGTNQGQLFFNDGRNKLFSGSMSYAPGPQDLVTQFHLQGDPQVVNVLFNSENFFFGSGNFKLDIGLEGTPENMEQVFSNAKFNLLIDSTRILYQPANAYIPVRTFAVNLEKEHADFNLHLLTDETKNSVYFDGTLDNLTAFLVPKAGKRFHVKANLRAPFLQWSDLNSFIQADTSETAQTDFDSQTFFSATKGAFRSFRPELRLAIDTFLIKDTLQLTAIGAHVKLDDELGLVLDDSGFTLGEGNVELNARYALDEKENSPFSADWKIDNLDFAHVLKEMTSMEIALPDDLKNLVGKLTMNGSLTGTLDESNQHILLNKSHGKLTYQLTELELANTPALRNIGKKLKMRKRFRHLRFAPLAGDIQLDSGLITFPRLEVQNTGVQLFVEGEYNLRTGPDLLISFPLRNIGRGVLDEPPPQTGLAKAGWKVYLVTKTGKDGEVTTKFRLGRRRYYKKRGRLKEFKLEKQKLRQQRKKEREER